MTRRPNLLVVMCDQLSAASLPAYGHPVVRAPHVDGLAAGGTVFERAYCASPLCAPSRYAMLAGRRCSAIGAYDNAAELGASVPTLAHHLRRLGYQTALAGKMHFAGPDQLHGFETRLTTDVYPADFGWTPDWTRPAQRPFWYHDMLSVVEAGPYERTLQLDYDEEVHHRARRHLYDLAREESRPFLLVVSFTQPHDPYMTPRRYWDRYAADAIDPPAWPAAPPGEVDPHASRLREVCAMDAYRLGEDRVRNARHAYYGMIAHVDDLLGSLLEALRHTGRDDDTVVVFTADHGDMLGERGLWYKMCFYERAVRVPLVVTGPGWAAGHRVATPVSHLDLLPTLLEIATDGALTTAPEAPTDGAGLGALAAAGGERGPVFAEYLAEGTTEPMLMVVEGRHKYVTCPGDPPRLFDLAADPHERRNLAGDPAAAAVATRLADAAAAYWDPAAVRAVVVESQARRRLVHAALLTGARRPWDYSPREDGSRRYNRNDAGELYDTDRRYRIPRRAAPPPDGA